MNNKLKVWIYCRVLSHKAEDLLDEQESILRSFAADNDMEIVGVTREISKGRDFASDSFQYLISKIKKGTMEAILFYDNTRITVFEDLYVEFELICQKYDIYLIPLKSIVDKQS